MSASTGLWNWIIAGAYLCFILTEVLIPWLSERWFSSYRSLKRSVMLEWNARWTSTIHAIFICSCSAWCLAFHENLWKDKLFGTDYFSEVVLGLSCGYMIYDMLTMCMYTKGIALASFLVHHLVAIGGLYTVLANNFGKFLFHYKMLTELSTPCVNLRWRLRFMNYPADHPYSAWTTVILGISFVSVRLVGSIPFWIWVIGSVNQAQTGEHAELMQALKAVLFFLAIMLDVLNVFWTVLIVPRCIFAAKALNKYYKSSSYPIN